MNRLSFRLINTKCFYSIANDERNLLLNHKKKNFIVKKKVKKVKKKKRKRNTLCYESLVLRNGIINETT